MAGYSGTPLIKKLGIKEGCRAAVIGAPAVPSEELRRVIRESGAVDRLAGRAKYDVIVTFVDSQRLLAKRFPAAAARLVETGGLWVAWPKKASGVVTDVTEDVVREVGLAAGLVDNKVCAVDEVWSGLRFVVRVGERKGTKGRRDKGTEGRVSKGRRGV